MTKPNTILKISISIILILLGIYQEVFYYKYVFIANGLGVLTSYIAGISLAILLSFFAYRRNYLLFSVLLVFSVFTSVVGQSTAYAHKQQTFNTNTLAYTQNKNLYTYYTDQIQQIDDTIQLNEQLLPKTIEDRAIWKTNGVEPIEQKIEELKAEKKEYELQLLDISNKLSTGTRELTAFENLSKDIPFLSPTLLKYAFQVFMSLFIALMSPSGVVVLSTVYTQPKKEDKKKVKKTVEVSKTLDKYSLYANSRYCNMEQPEKLNSRKNVVEETGLSYTEFNDITKRAVSLGLFSVRGNKTVPNVSRSEFDLRIRNDGNEKIRSFK